MGGRTRLGRISDADYSDLLRALSGTLKGRLFLSEYLRRARPQETGALLDALQRIEDSMGAVRDQLQPERVGDELRRIAMTLEIATDGAERDDDRVARRLALVERAKQELLALAATLVGERRKGPRSQRGGALVFERGELSGDR